MTLFATDSEVVLVVQYVPTIPHSEGFALRSAFFGSREPEIGCVCVCEGVSAGNGGVRVPAGVCERRKARAQRVIRRHDTILPEGPSTSRNYVDEPLAVI